MALRFLWDETKAVSNQQKHGVSFEEAQTVFYDPLAETNFDIPHSEDEDRYITIGYSLIGVLLVVVHTDTDGAIRIISARQATKGEERRYEQGSSD